MPGFVGLPRLTSRQSPATTKGHYLSPEGVGTIDGTVWSLAISTVVRPPAGPLHVYMPTKAGNTNMLLYLQFQILPVRLRFRFFAFRGSEWLSFTRRLFCGNCADLLEPGIIVLVGRYIY